MERTVQLASESSLTITALVSNNWIDPAKRGSIKIADPGPFWSPRGPQRRCSALVSVDGARLPGLARVSRPHAAASVAGMRRFIDERAATCDRIAWIMAMSRPVENRISVLSGSLANPIERRVPRRLGGRLTVKGAGQSPSLPSRTLKNRQTCGCASLTTMRRSSTNARQRAAASQREVAMSAV
jgi:hypothetical protein